MSSIQIVPTLKDAINEDSCWSASFGLAWDKFQSEILNSDFSYNGSSSSIKNLMSPSDIKIIFNEKKYFSEVGKTNLEFKEKIIDLNKKIFDDNFNPFNNIMFNSENYTICSKNEFQLDFEISYENMNINKFGTYENNVEFFGFIQDYTKYNEQITPLFYHDKSNFAVSLHSTTNQSIILYRTNANNTFEDVFNELQRKIEEASVGEYSLSISSFACPKIKIDLSKNFNELCGEKFTKANGEIVEIDNAVQNLTLELNEKGMMRRDEAIISLNEINCYPLPIQTNFKDFIFNDNFYVFIFDEDSISFDNPIGAIKVKNIENFI